MFRFCLAVLLSSTLLFVIQPLCGKVLLPRYGGVAIVWTTAVLVFQLLLFAGYLWALVLQRYCSPRTGWMLHLIALAAAVGFVPLRTIERDFSDWNGSVSGAVVADLMWIIGPAFVVLSATNPLIQGWFALRFPNRNPYRLSALSNAGSLGGLLLFPSLLEPNVGLDTLKNYWRYGFVAAALVIALAGVQVFQSRHWKFQPSNETPERSRREKISGAMFLSWVLLPAVGAALMMAVNTVLVQEVASFPFLWVIPLSAYLVSWIVAFDRPGWFRPGLLMVAWQVSATAGLMLSIIGTDASIMLHAMFLGSMVLFGGWICHGAMEASKPAESHLAVFWTASSLGGLIGSAIMVLVPPRVFTGFFEFHVAIFVMTLVGLAIVLIWGRRALIKMEGWKQACWVMSSGLIVMLATTVFVSMESINREKGMIASSRNDYGLASVWGNDEFRYIQSGQTMHGRQYLSPPRSLETADYYHLDRAVGRAILFLRKNRGNGSERKGIRIGVIGLGSGCLSILARPQDRIRFYELDPQMTEFAWRYFPALATTRAAGAMDGPVVVGDARVRMNEERKTGQSGKFDILIVDAFTSDSIPAHLLTRECLELYRYHLVKDGLLAIHISNRNIDLRPVLKEPGNSLTSLLFEHESGGEGDFRSTWVLLGAANGDWVDFFQPLATPWPRDLRAVRWTDDHWSIFPLVDWHLRFDLRTFGINSDH